MSISGAQARIKAQVWQAVAQSELDVSGIDKAQLTSLIDFVSEAALIAVDGEMEESFLPASQDTAVSPDIFLDDKEDILWEGRPFLSISLYYTITDERIRVTSGILGKARDNIELVRIQDLNYKQTMSERMLNLGDIFVTSHDPNKPSLTLKNVRDPEGVYEILRRAVLQARKKHGFTYQEEM